MRKRKTACALSFISLGLCISHSGLKSAIGNTGKYSSDPTLLPCDFAKILSDVWFEVEVPRARTTEQRGVNDGAPHNRVLQYIECAERGRIHNYQQEYRHHDVARPWFARGKTVRDRGHQAANHGDERGGDMQPF